MRQLEAGRQRRFAAIPRHAHGHGICWILFKHVDDGFSGGPPMSYDILKSLGLDHLDASSPDFMKTLERMQREAFQSLQLIDRHRDSDGPETIVG
jgi:hypothetical protein